MKNRRWLVGLLIFLMTGCNLQPTPAATSTFFPTETNTPILPTATTIPSATPLPLINAVCSPLKGIALYDLRLITSYDYSVKYPFSEGPENDKNHPAIDFGFYSSLGIPSYSGPELHTDDGFPIQALLPGRVVETVNDLYPYGNMILIETRLDALDPTLLAKLNLPQPYPQSELDAHNPCSKDQIPISWSQSSRSIYSLYAHMKNPSTLKTGEYVQCGEMVGAIGATGNSSTNIEHLHLEIRVGPSDARLGTISTYISTSTEEERYNYCIWALSEEFQSIDPSLFWETSSGSDQ